MSKQLKTAFAVHAVLAVIFGLPLLVVPGRLLTWLEWAPIDPIASRLLGAALLALGWSSFRGWQVAKHQDVRILVELEAAFTGLACLGLARHLFFARYSAFPWVVFGLLAAFFLVWVFFLVRKE